MICDHMYMLMGMEVQGDRMSQTEVFLLQTVLQRARTQYVEQRNSRNGDMLNQTHWILKTWWKGNQ